MDHKKHMGDMPKDHKMEKGMEKDMGKGKGHKPAMPMKGGKK